MHWPPAGAGSRSARPGGGGRQASARLRAEENASFLSYPHTLRAPRSRAADNKTPRPEEKRNSRKGKSPQKGGKRCRRDNAERRCRGDSAGETVQERRCRRETMQGRDDAGETMQHTGKKQNRPSKEQEPRTPRKPRLTRKTRLLPEKPRPARIRKKTPAGRCRE